MKPEKYMTIQEMKEGWLYQIDARNASVGIWNHETKDFTIARSKFGDTFLFEEYHYDANEAFGTAFPLKEIEEAPKFGSDQEKLQYLINKDKEYDI